MEEQQTPHLSHKEADQRTPPQLNHTPLKSERPHFDMIDGVLAPLTVVRSVGEMGFSF